MASVDETVSNSLIFDATWLARCRACSNCDLASTRQHVVVSRGNPQARLMVIGEAPGASEDDEGLPFVGRSGRLLDQLLLQAGFNPEADVFVSNVVKCRPPNNRKPTRLELNSCRPWIDDQLARVDPAVVILVGSTAVAAMLNRKQPMRDLRGQWIDHDGRRWMPIFHPAYLLRNPSLEPGKPVSQTVADLHQVQEWLCQGDGAFSAPIS